MMFLVLELRGNLPMNILYIGMSSHIGGIESFIFNTFIRLNDLGHNADFIAFEDHICFESEILRRGANIYHIPFRRNSPLGYLWGLFRFFSSHKGEYDVVHINLNSCSAIEPVFFSSLFGFRTIVHSHNAYKSHRLITSILNKINKNLLPLMTKNFLACSREAGVSMFGNRSFTFIPNGINILKYRYSPQLAHNLKNKYGLENKLIVGHVGRLNYQKNQKFLIKIFYEIHKIDPGAKLVLVGEGNDKAELEKEVASLKLKNDVLFYGKTNHVEKILNLFDVVVFPSLFEGLPISVIEYQANGLRCIISDQITDQVKATNLIYKMSLNESPAHWAEKAIELADQGREDMTDKLLKSSFSIDHECQVLLEYYRSIV